MKNIILICLLVAFTGCSGKQVRTICKNTSKKIASCCTSISIQKRGALVVGMTNESNEEKQPRYRLPTVIFLLEWDEAVHVW